MDPNTSSPNPAGTLTALAAVADELATEDLDGLPDAVRAERVLVLRRLLDRLEGHWLGELAGVDARGAAGADQGIQAASTAGWLRARLRLGASAASSAVRTARVLFRGPLTATAAALTAGEISVAHAQALAHGIQELPTQIAHQAEPTLLAALAPLARPTSAEDARSAGQRTADALTELARRQLEGGRLPRTGGVRPQLTVTVDLDSLLGRPGAVGGDAGWAGPLDPEACRRFACDGALTRVLVTRHHHERRGPQQGSDGHHRSGDDHHRRGAGHHPSRDNPGADQASAPRPAGNGSNPPHPGNHATLIAQLQAAIRRLPPTLGGRPANPWRWAGPPEWSRPANAGSWPCATAAVSSLAVIGPWPGAKPTMCGTGWTAAPPTWTT